LRHGIFNYIFINVFQVIFNVNYVKFDMRFCCRFLSGMNTLLTGDLIRAARGLLGMSQTELAQAAGLTQKALGEFELGKRVITAKANQKLRLVFEERRVQFIAANIEDTQLDGTGVRWKPTHPNAGVKTI
jgi:DNA-binding XRE family transcriptional regulator